MEGYIKVKKGDLVTTILKKNQKNYLANGWKVLKEEPKPKPKTYDSYTKNQLIDIAKNRNIHFSTREKKQVIIDRLIVDDEQSSIQGKPSNKGFTDNLIIEN